MSVKIYKKLLTHREFKFNAMAFVADKEALNHHENIFALMTHGYTASKTDCINWAQRLSEAGINCVIFDQPGHFLGSYNEVNSFEEYTQFSHECFISAYEFLKSSTNLEPNKVVFAGHSLGALQSLRAIELEYFKEFEKLAICVGYGLNQSGDTHIFSTSFYEKTLNIRRQLVSDAINPDLIFPWIKEFKEKIEVTNQKIHLICGKDDVIVGLGGMEYLEEVLSTKGNQVTSNMPNRLPHNNPEIAASHIFSYLKKELQLK